MVLCCIGIFVKDTMLFGVFFKDLVVLAYPIMVLRCIGVFCKCIFIRVSCCTIEQGCWIASPEYAFYPKYWDRQV